MNRTEKLPKLAIYLVVLIMLLSFPLAAHAKDKIVIGNAVALTGPYGVVTESTTGPVYDMWVEEVNARGGIYVKEYGKRLPVELIRADDKTDLGTNIRLTEKFILQDKVDFMLAPTGTAFLYAAAPIYNKHKYIMLGGPGGAIKLKEIAAGLPYFFSVLNFADTQMVVLADIYKELGVKSAAVIFIADLHGVEYSGVVVPELAKRGIEIRMVQSFPLGIKDLSPLLKKAKALDVDAFVGITYPSETFLATGQAIALGLNFKIFHNNVMPSFPAYRDAFGKDAAGNWVVEGVMGPGAYNKKSSPGAKGFIDKFMKRFKKEPEYWGGLQYYASLEFFEQAIQKAGTLDQSVIKDVMATETFDTFLGPFKFENHFFRGQPGHMGQWQNGIFEVIDPGSKRTAAPIYPKPPWPKPKPKK